MGVFVDRQCKMSDVSCIADYEVNVKGRGTATGQFPGH